MLPGVLNLRLRHGFGERTKHQFDGAARKRCARRMVPRNESFLKSGPTRFRGSIRPCVGPPAGGLPRRTERLWRGQFSAAFAMNRILCGLCDENAFSAASRLYGVVKSDLTTRRAFCHRCTARGNDCNRHARRLAWDNTGGELFGRHSTRERQMATRRLDAGVSRKLDHRKP